MHRFGEFFINHWDLFLGLFVVGGMLFYTTFSARLRGFSNVSPQETVQLINRENALLLDVREDNEVASGFISDSIHIPLGKLRGRIGELTPHKDRPVVIGCRSGHRSASACGMLRKQGFERVYNLRGGIMAWENASLPLSRSGKRKKTKRAASGRAVKKVQETSAMAKVEMYSTGGCPYCVRARQLLERKGVSYTEYRVDDSPELRPEMERRASGGTSVPQIFINDRHIGGCDEMHALDAAGELDPLLQG